MNNTTTLYLIAPSLYVFGHIILTRGSPEPTGRHVGDPNSSFLLRDLDDKTRS